MGPPVLVRAPFAPHVAEELWQRLGHEGSLTYVAYRMADPALLVAESVAYPVRQRQSAGTHRDRRPRE